jgi:hypothetical protein
MPKPEWMVERDAERAAEAAKNEEGLWQEVIRRNKAAKRAVVDLPAKKLLMLELAEHDTAGGTLPAHDIARDSSSPYSDFLTAQNCA